MSNRITREVVEAFLQCKTKGMLRYSGQRGDHVGLRGVADRQPKQDDGSPPWTVPARPSPDEVVRDEPLTADLLRRGPPLILNATLEDGRFSLLLDGLKRVDGPSKLGDFHYVPVLFHGGRQVGREQRLLLEVYGLLLSRVQGQVPGPRGRLARPGVPSGPGPPEQRPAQGRAACCGTQGTAGQPARRGWSSTTTARSASSGSGATTRRSQEDNLSLLRGMGEKEIRRLRPQGHPHPDPVGPHLPAPPQGQAGRTRTTTTATTPCRRWRSGTSGSTSSGRRSVPDSPVRSTWTWRACPTRASST